MDGGIPIGQSLPRFSHGCRLRPPVAESAVGDYIQRVPPVRAEGGEVLAREGRDVPIEPEDDPTSVGREIRRRLISARWELATPLFLSRSRPGQI
jgi:hypothetical protein